MYCSKCGREIIPDGPECPCSEGEQAQGRQSLPVLPAAKMTSEQKLLSVLSYIGILWIIGLVAYNDKNDPRVKFHVGQGIMLTIYSMALNIAKSVFTGVFSLLFRMNTIFPGVSYNYVGFSFFGLINTYFSFIIWGTAVALAVIGIMRVVDGGQDKPLPFIGKFAFYR